MRVVIPTEPDADRPRQVPGTEVTELAAGLLVRPAGSATAHQLNNTASVIFNLCDGTRTITQITATFAGAFSLGTLPLAEVTACVTGLRQAGILAGPTRRTAEIGTLKDQTDNPFGFFDAIFCLNLDDQTERWAAALRRFSVLEIADRVERFSAISTPRNRSVGCTSSWRLMVAQAHDLGLRNFLGIEDDAIFLDETLEVLRRAISELKGIAWDLLYLGGAAWEPPVEIPGRTALRTPRSLTCTHALAVNETAYERLLAEIPEAHDIEGWIAGYAGVDQYLSQRVDAGHYRAYVLHPRVATQIELTGVANLDAPLRDRYTIR
jgi:hypothetical protein